MQRMDDFFDNKTPKQRCEGCTFCKQVYANGQWSFFGCYYPPYRGKWVAKIKDCPKTVEGGAE